jgi:hypothetical protein
LTIPIQLVILHFICDWYLQNDKMALGKSKDNWILLTHASVATIYTIWWGPLFWLSNLILHFVVDYFTSRGTSKLWFVERYCKSSTNEDDCGWEVPVFNKNRHKFFVLIGFDQMVHYICLAITYKLLAW